MQNGKNSGLREKFGEELMQGGFTSLPNLMMNLYAALGITSPEMMFILQMWTHWYEKQEDMHPALTTIALRMNVSRRQAGRYVQSLKTKSYHDPDTGYQSQPYVQVHERYAQDAGSQLSNQYNFSGFLDALLYLARRCGLVQQTQPLETPPPRHACPGPPDIHV
jgi:hypothetical protein